MSPRNPIMQRTRTVAAAVVATLVVGAILAACSAGGAGASAGAPAASAAPNGIVREALGSARPDAAPGQELGLWHYTIAPGSKLVPHHHPGWQVARVTAGTLTYTIIGGTAQLIRADGTSETHGAGETITVATGETVVENPATQHFGANDGTTPVEIYTSTLFEAGQPPAIPLASPSPSPS